MALTVQATYENGTLKLDRPLPLKEHQIVLVTVHTEATSAESAAGIIPCSDRRLIEWAALDADLEHPPSGEEP